MSISARPKAAPAAPAAPRDRAYDAAAVAAAWEAYIAAHSDEHVLINTMRAAVPTRLASGRYGVSVPTPVQGRLLAEVKTALLAHIREALANDSFDFDINVEQKGPSPEYWNDREVLAHMARTYPGFETFMKDLALTLL